MNDHELIGKMQPEHRILYEGFKTIFLRLYPQGNRGLPLFIGLAGYSEYRTYVEREIEIFAEILAEKHSKENGESYDAIDVHLTLDDDTTLNTFFEIEGKKDELTFGMLNTRSNIYLIEKNIDYSIREDSSVICNVLILLTGFPDCKLDIIPSHIIYGNDSMKSALDRSKEWYNDEMAANNDEMSVDNDEMSIDNA